MTIEPDDNEAPPDGADETCLENAFWVSEHLTDEGCWEQAFLALGPFGNAFRERLETYTARAPSKRRRELNAFSKRIELGQYAPGLNDYQRNLALHMVWLYLKETPTSKPGRKTGPATEHARIYSAAIQLAPLCLISEHISQGASVEAERLADDQHFCARQGLTHLPRQERVALLTAEVQAQSPRLAKEYLASTPLPQKGQASAPSVARRMMAHWRGMPEVPQHFKNAAHPDTLRNNEQCRAEQKSRRKARQV